MSFDEIGTEVDFPKLEHKILKLWACEKSFEQLLRLNSQKKPWSFIDGPITANNPMGIHHAWGRTIKDFFRRYKSMRGYYDRYHNGFDVQGLWVEVEVEKELGFKSKREIETYGVANFVKRCKQRALRSAAQQTEQSIRLGYWMNWDDPKFLRYLAERMENPNEIITVQGKQGKLNDNVEQIVGKLGSGEIGDSYFTFSNENNYTIWMFLKKCHELELLYKGSDVMPWCPRCSTGISQHEILTDGYRELTHTTVTVRFPLRKMEGSYLLVWTTTPWTLTSNVAVAVNPKMEYVKVEHKNEYYYLARTALQRIFPKADYSFVEALSGEQMENWEYSGPFDELNSEKNAKADENHRVILWEEITEEEGTGIVHIAPGCGKEDLELAKLYGLPKVSPLNEFGIFTEGFGIFTGKSAQDTGPLVVAELQRKRLLFKSDEYSHRYPVCWRCGSELVYRLVSEWFINMGKKIEKPIECITEEEKKTNLRFRIMESAQHVKWVPAFGLSQELNWLNNMDDWMISKKRYWGLALPIWECHKCNSFEVIGSDDELKSKAVEGWEIFQGHTPHRPWIDAVKIKCSKCGSVISRISDVGNPWLDAGIVAYSTLNYRHNREYWKKWFPAELVAESLPGQFRNWFYAMLAMSTVLEGTAPFKVCFGHGDVLAEDGREMHKSWGNAIWFDDAVEIIGADVLRWLYLSSNPESNLLFGYKKADAVKRRFFIPLWNIYSFFVTYANIDNWQPPDLPKKSEMSPLDKWIMMKLGFLVEEVVHQIEEYSPINATIAIEKFVNSLSTWYLRRSRRRFWKTEKDDDKEVAYITLYTVLTALSKILAPFTPFIAEELYQNLIRKVSPDSAKSVHHTSWPRMKYVAEDTKLAAAMDLAIIVCEQGRSARSKARIKLRQPVSDIKIVAEKPVLEKLTLVKDIIANELNAKAIFLESNRTSLFRTSVRLLPQNIGKKYGRLFPKISAAFASLNPEDVVSTLRETHNLRFTIDNHEVVIPSKDIEISTVSRNEYSVCEYESIMVGVNRKIGSELKMEGFARDIVRRIQNQRKQANFNIEDSIETYYETDDETAIVFDVLGEYIASETLSIKMHKEHPPEEAHSATYVINDKHLTIGIILAKRK